MSSIWRLNGRDKKYRLEELERPLHHRAAHPASHASQPRRLIDRLVMYTQTIHLPETANPIDWVLLEFDFNYRTITH